MNVSKEQARRFLLRHQGLLGRKWGQPREVFEGLRLVQYDPLNPCGRNVDLVLQARVEGYHPDDFREWAYEQQRVVEGFDKVLCLLPVEDYGFLRFGAGQMWSARHEFAEQHAAELDEVVAFVEANGPVMTGGIVDDRVTEIGWRKENAWGKVALETLWRQGKLAITRDTRQRKQYDLPERVFADLPRLVPTVEEHIERRIGAVGMLPVSGGGTGWLGIGLGRELRSTIKAMVESGRLVEVRVDGVKTVYVVRGGDARGLEGSKESEGGGADDVKEMKFLAPLDNVLWDRRMILELFDFDYKWEVYVPAAKRKFGYYVLPMLYGDRLVGRIEPVLNKEKGLEIKGVWWEEGMSDKRAKRALDKAVEKFRRYLRTDKL